MDNAGRVVPQQESAGHLDMRQLANGLYHLHLWQDGQVRSQRIEVRH